MNEPATDTILHMSAVSKSFSGFVAVAGVSLDVRRGSIHALIGPNGAGKTTLFNLATKFLSPSSGRIIFKGRDITGESPSAVARLGMVRSFQISAVFQSMSARENVRVALQTSRSDCFAFWRSASALKALNARADALLEDVGLADLRERKASELAYGQQRLLEIALALATKPKVLLLDEPAAGVPRRQGGELFEVIGNLPADIAVLFIEHDMDVVFRFASRVIVMVGGTLLVEGTPVEIAADPRVREVYLGRAHHG